MVLGIFERVVEIKYCIEGYSKSLNPFKRMTYNKITKQLIKKMEVIREAVIDISILTDWHKFISLGNNSKISNIEAKYYEYDDKYIEEIIIKNNKENNICILLKFNKNIIDVEYVTSDTRVSKTYKSVIEDEDDIRDKYTNDIIDIIRNSIYGSILVYLKGE